MFRTLKLFKPTVTHSCTHEWVTGKSPCTVSFLKRVSVASLADLLIVIAVLFPLQSCTFFNDGSVESSGEERARLRQMSNPPADVSIVAGESMDSEVLPPLEELKTDFGVELIWDVPAEAVEGFVLYTGIRPDQLDTEIHIAVSKLQTIEGNKYRYLLKPVAKGEILYVSIAAINHGEISEKSPVQKIEGENR